MSPQAIAARRHRRARATRRPGAREPLLVARAADRASSTRTGWARASPRSSRSATVTRTSPTRCARGDADLVVRRPPRGPLPPSAHDVLREARVLRALDGRAPVPRVLAVCDDDGADRRAVLRDGAARGRASSRRRCSGGARRRSGAARIGEALVDALVTLHARRLARRRAGGLRPAGRLPASASSRASAGSWERNRTRELPAVDRVGRWLGDAPAAVAAGDDRARRLPARQRDVRAGAARSRRRDPRLGDVDDRRPARRPRLPVRRSGSRARIRRPASSSSTRSRAPAASPRARSWSRATSSAPGARSATCAGTRRWRSGRSSSSWRANYRRALAGSVDDPYLTSFGEAIAELAERAEAITRCA